MPCCWISRIAPGIFPAAISLRIKSLTRSSAAGEKPGSASAGDSVRAWCGQPATRTANSAATRPEKILAVVKTPVADRTEAQTKELLEWFRTADVGLIKKEQALYTSKQPLPIDPKLLELRAAAAKAELPVPIDSKLVQLRADVIASTPQTANKRLTGVQDLAWALVNNPAFLFNR